MGEPHKTLYEVELIKRKETPLEIANAIAFPAGPAVLEAGANGPAKDCGGVSGGFQLVIG